MRSSTEDERPPMEQSKSIPLTAGKDSIKLLYQWYLLHYSGIMMPATGEVYLRLLDAGIVLPRPPRPIGNFATHVQEGALLFLSGQGPQTADGELGTGKVGDGVSVEQAYAHARLAGINLIAVLHEALGDLARVKRVVK